MDKRETARALIAIQNSIRSMSSMFSGTEFGDRAGLALHKAARLIEEEAFKMEDEHYSNEAP